MNETTPYCFMLHNAVEAEFLSFARTFTERNLYRFEANSAGTNRRFFKFDVSQPDFPEFGALKQRLAAHFGLGAYVTPPRLQDFIGYVTDGGAVHEHLDPDLPGKRHVRINVLLSSSEGCVPVMDGVPITVNRGDAWLNLASRCRHGTTAASGPGHRSVVSFGYQIEPRRGDELFALHSSWRSGISSRDNAA